MTAVEVMTINCASAKPGWAKRAPVQANRILRNAPDVVVCTELYAARRGSLVRRVRHRYTVAVTHMGKVILVRKARGIGIHSGSVLRMHLGHGKHAVAIRLVRGGEKVVVVAVHLSWRISDDARREIETRRLVLKVSKRYGTTPVIYAGDWNSSIVKGKRKRDAVGDVFRKFGIGESYRETSHRANAKYNSANRYLRPAPANGVHLDRIFGSGVTFTSWCLDYYQGRYGADHFPVIATAKIGAS